MAKDQAKAVYDAAQALSDAITTAEAAGYTVGPAIMQKALKIITVSGGTAEAPVDDKAPAAAAKPVAPADKLAT